MVRQYRIPVWLRRKISKYYTRGTELISVDIVEEAPASGVPDVDGENTGYTRKIYIQDGHGSITALVEAQANVITTYAYDAYGNLLKKTGITDNDHLYTVEQYNETTRLYCLRARYMSPETGMFTSMDTYAGSLDNPVSLRKYLYANANPVTYKELP